MPGRQTCVTAAMKGLLRLRKPEIRGYRRMPHVPGSFSKKAPLRFGTGETPKQSNFGSCSDVQRRHNNLYAAYLVAKSYCNFW